MNPMKPFSSPIWKQWLPWAAVLAGFLFLAYAYTPQVLQGKIVNQSDISSWHGMSREIVTWNEAHPDNPTLWTNSMFAGMPATSISVIYQGDWTKPFYDLLFTGARPASYLFLSLAGSLLLMLAFGASLPLAVLGAVAVTFCSYNMQIIQVGHNSKMVAIAFMPWVLAAVAWAYRRKPLWGALLFAFALSFQIKANHPQITYYLAIVILGLALAEGISALYRKAFPCFLRTSLLLLAAGILGIATNANHLIPTYEYAEHTMRGGSELSGDEKNRTGDGLDLDYATAWSYGIEETPNLLIPNFNGGASTGELSRRSASAQVLRNYQGGMNLLEQMPLYWGPQPFTAGPMYLGAVSLFLFVLGLAVIRGRYKWWIAGVSLLALLLAWGSHFLWFSELWFRYIPLYNKFRTVSMILVILQVLVPLLGGLAVQSLLAPDGTPGSSTGPAAVPAREKRRGLWTALGITGGICLIFGLIPSLAGSFVSPVDGAYPEDLARALATDRQMLLRTDALRSLVFIVLAAGVLWLGLGRRLKPAQTVWLLALLVLVDLWGIDRRYLNGSHFVSERQFGNQFAPRTADRLILEDPDQDYRVLDLSVNTFNDAHSSYHHKTIGGYSPAKLQRYQDLIEHRISPEMQRLTADLNAAIPEARSVADLENALGNYPVLSMLNTRYIIVDGNSAPLRYAGAGGNGWFAGEILRASGPDEEMALLGKCNPLRTAVVSERDIPADAVLTPGSGSIVLKEYAPNRLVYTCESETGGLAVFSEVHYPGGWFAEVDGQEVPVYRANYILRAVQLPAGRHEVVFRFDPPSFRLGERISRAASAAVFLLLAGTAAAGMLRRRRPDANGAGGIR